MARDSTNKNRLEKLYLQQTTELLQDSMRAYEN